MLLSAIVTVGMLVEVDWKLEPDYHNCVGKLHKIEYIEELNHAITVIKDMKCPNEGKKEWVGTTIGIRVSHLKPASLRARSWYGL